MKIKKITDTALKVCTAVLLLTAFLLTFTVSDYYIFNRFDKYGFFAVCQWIKKCGLLVIPLAVYFDKKCCKDIAKYVLPVFVIVSFFTFGDFFDVTPVTESSTADELIYAKINAIIPKTLNMSLFFIQGALFLIICAMLFITDGFKFKIKSCIWLAPAIVAVTPLNIFENFFDIKNFNENSFLWFKNFSLWHFLAVAALAGYTVSCYYFLRKKDAKLQNEYLAAAAIVLLIHYHSKDSMIMGDGYNVYHTIFACVPLFICNIGVYMAALSVFLEKNSQPSK